MSGASNVAAMKKVVQQLRLEASVSRVKVWDRCERKGAVCHLDLDSRAFLFFRGKEKNKRHLANQGGTPPLLQNGECVIG
ncbi:Guanine nucleotide-binding protein subunit gamma [Crotalus adamanteus]|uniref:Guanine nucleotide-binding protein subunit gamma n=1 Tax=Crotalus adamanteus TaxID=8729 RepID=A0AAW1BQ44_CROAD